MSRWDDLGKSQPAREYDQVLVEGSFQCGTCNEFVDAAVYLPQEHVLTWKCLNEHKTFIDKVNL